MGAAVVEYYRAPCFIPPHIESKLNPESHVATQKLRIQRAFDLQQGHRHTVGAIAKAETVFNVYNAKHREELPGKLLSQRKLKLDDDAKRAFEGSRKVYEFYKTIFGRNSIDGRGMNIDSTVHFGVEYANAFWNGERMVYGDGSKRVGLVTFTRDLDV
ncbi:MAG: hypothetical protein ACK5MA_05590, partial [Parachlamydiaceae bacterium]